jgi:CRISPR/Cas system-associated endoribonuclease Cas2
MTQTSLTLDPSAIQKVIEKEVSEITDDDVTSLIIYFRQEREQFAAKEATGKTKRAPASAADLNNLLTDLDV